MADDGPADDGPADDGPADDEFADARPRPRGPRRAKTKSGGVPTWAWIVGGVAAGAFVLGGCFLALLIPAIQQARGAGEKNAAAMEATRAELRAAADTAPPPVAAGTEAEARALGEAFVAAVGAGDADAVAALIDIDTLAGHVTAGMDLDPKMRSGLLTGLRGGRAANGPAVRGRGGRRRVGFAAAGPRPRGRPRGPDPGPAGGRRG